VQATEPVAKVRPDAHPRPCGCEGGLSSATLDNAASAPKTGAVINEEDDVPRFDLTTLRGGLSDASTAMSLARLAGDARRRGYVYDSDPQSPRYAANHFTQDLQAGEVVTRAYAGNVGVGSSHLPAVVRETNLGNVYVDPYRLPPAPSLPSKLAARRLASIGLQRPMSFGAADVQMTETPGRVDISAPGVNVMGLPDAPLGAVTNMSLGEQARHAWRLARG
jgi:hypothetical protein